MVYYAVKVVLSAMLIVVIAETAKRSSLFGALVASLPLMSILAIFWIYYDTGDLQKISDFSKQIVWLVIPSLIYFIALLIFFEKRSKFLSQ